jgi:D-glucosaminate-6-phosphate ammonia-lyase
MALDLSQFRVINASGRMTALGGTTLSVRVAEAMVRASSFHFDMERLLEWAGQRIAEITDTEAATVVASASAGIVLSVAAVIAGTDPLRTKELPCSGGERRIVVQQGHLIDFGAEIAQMVRLGGGIVAPIGSVNRVESQDLEAILKTRPAALLYVQSHHTARKGMRSLQECIEVAHQESVPVIVDAAAESDLQRFTRAGADLVIYSGSKDFLGPTSGFVCGRRTYIEAVRAQMRGIGRAMKVSKEAVAGLIQALEDFTARDALDTGAQQEVILARLMEILSRIPGARTILGRDEVRPAIARAEVHFVGESAYDHASKFVRHLRSWRPPIWTRDHRLSEGIIAFDPRPLVVSDLDIIASAIDAFNRVSPTAG